MEDDFDVLRQHKGRVLFGMSITATPDKSKIMQVVEQNASPIKERMRVMRRAHRQGLRTYAMLCPLLPGIADSPRQIDRYVQFAESTGAEEIFAEAVNGRGRSIILTQEALQEAGYVKEAQSVEAIRRKKNCSAYALQLIKQLQRSVREHSDIRKLRFLLYPKTLSPEHVEQLRKDDKGVIWLT